MSQVITATFEDGLLKPDEQLDLPPHTRVRLTVEPLGEMRTLAGEAWRELEQLWDNTAVDSGGVRLTRDQLHDRR